QVERAHRVAPRRGTGLRRHAQPGTARPHARRARVGRRAPSDEHAACARADLRSGAASEAARRSGVSAPGAGGAVNAETIGRRAIEAMLARMRTGSVEIVEGG